MSAFRVRVLRQRLSLAWLAVGTGVMLWPTTGAEIARHGWSAPFWLLGAPLLMLALTRWWQVLRLADLRVPAQSSSPHRRQPQATRRVARARRNEHRRARAGDASVPRRRGA